MGANHGIGKLPGVETSKGNRVGYAPMGDGDAELLDDKDTRGEDNRGLQRQSPPEEAPSANHGKNLEMGLSRDLDEPRGREASGAPMSGASARAPPPLNDVRPASRQRSSPSSPRDDGCSPRDGRSPRPGLGSARVIVSPRQGYVAEVPDTHPTRGPNAEPQTGGVAADDDDAETRYNAHIAAGKVLSILMKRGRYACNVETSSVYGAAIVMPQIARSAGWSRMLTYLAIRSYLFVLVNFVVQTFLLFLISKEEVIMDGFAGQMYLCDFGAGLRNCPDGPGCTGPGGTKYTAKRLYGWDQWAARNFVKESLKQLFPDRIDDINNLVDPGEYGLESYQCRWLCCFLFMMSVMSDLLGSVYSVYLHWKVPTKAEYWLTYEVPSWGSKSYCKAVRGWSELDLVRVKVAGMPLHWKAFNSIFIIVPKLALWFFTSRAGTTFLMETSSIEDLIVNSIALTFILSIDELICENFTTQMTRSLLNKLEGYPLADTTEEENMTDEQNVRVTEAESLCNRWSFKDILLLVPTRLLATVSLTVLFVNSYYYDHCVRGKEGNWISHAMYFPKDLTYTLINFALPNYFQVPKSESPFWQPSDIEAH